MKMKRSLILINILLCPTYLSAQKLVAKVPIADTQYIINSVVFDLGESIVLSYRHPNASSSNIEKTMIISADGSVKEFIIPELRKKTFIDVIENSDSLFFNFLEQDKREIQLRVIAINKNNGESGSIKNIAVISENILGGFYENGYNLVTINQHDSTLCFNQIIKNSLKAVSKYKLPSVLFKKNASRSIVFIKEGDKISGSAGVASTKIYYTPKEIIVVDKVLANTANKQGATVTRIDRITGESKNKFFKEPTTGIYNSFFIGEDLYWAEKDNGLHIVVSNWSQNLNTEYFVNKKSTFINEMGRSYTVEDAIKKGTKAFIVGYSNNDGSVYLKTGTNQVFQTSAVPIIPGLGLITSALALAKITTFAMDEGVSADYDFYLKKDSIGFSYIKSPPIVENKIYSYEMEDVKGVTKKFKYFYKEYYKSPYGIIGLYIKNVKPREFEIVRFDN